MQDIRNIPNKNAYKKPTASRLKWIMGSAHKYAKVSIFLTTYFAGIISKFGIIPDSQIDVAYLLLFVIGASELVIWILITKRYYSKNIVSTGLMLLYIAMGIYLLVPTALLAFNLEIFPFSEMSIKNAMIGQSIALTHLYIFIHLLISPKLVNSADVNIQNWLSKLRGNQFGELMVSFFGLLVASAYLYVFYAAGVSELIGNESRIVIAKTAETGKTWLLQYVFFAWLMALSCLSFFRNKLARSSLIARAIQLFAIALFMYAYLSIGNRRELAIFLIFLLLLSVNSGKNHFRLLIITLFPALLLLGIFRTLQGSAVVDFDFTTNILNLLGEFIFPHYSLIYYSGISNFEFHWGQSFVLLPHYALPGFGLWEKANSLSIDFASEYANLNMGYAFTPLAEGYVNFGWASVVIAPMLLAATIRLILQHSKLAPFGLLVLFSFPLDISRGEFTTIAFQWIIFTVVFALVARIYTSSVLRGLR